MSEEQLRLICLRYAMEIYRKSSVPHMVVSNVADELYEFVKSGDSQRSIAMRASE